MALNDELLLTLRQIGADDIADGLENVADQLGNLEKSQEDANKVNDEAVKGDQEHKKSLLEVNAALDLFGKGINAAKEFAQAAIGDTMAYAKSVRDLSTNIGISVEETSKIIQAADDYGIGVGEVTSALQMMTRRGIAPSIDKLADMADQFVKIQDPVKRAEVMTEAFGRSWTTLTPLLKEGGQALRDSAAEAEKMGLVLSEKDVQAARQLEINIDNLNDRVEALKLKIGNALIPVLNDAATAFDNLTQGVGSADEKENELSAAVARNVAIFGQQGPATEKAAEALRHYLWVRQEVSMTEQEHTTRVAMGQIRALQDTTRWTAASAEGLKALALANQTAGPAQEQYNKWLHDEANAAAAAALSMKELTTQTIYNTAAAGLDANAALVLAERMGLVDKDALGAAKAIQTLKDNFKNGKGSAEDYASSIIRIQDAIAGLKDKNVTVTIETIQKEIRAQELEQRKEESGKLRAYGGAVGAGVPYIIGEQGRETYIPQQAGIVVPNSVTTSITNNITTDRLGVALAMARAQQMAAEARM